MIELQKPVRRIVRDKQRNPLVLTLAPEGVYIREKGRRVEYPPMAYGVILAQCASLFATEQRRSRRTREAR